MHETQEMWVQSLGGEGHLEKEKATHCNILAWKILWTGEPSGLQYLALQRVRYDWVTKHTHNGVQWLRLRAPNAGGLGSIPGQGTTSLAHATKSSCTTTTDLLNFTSAIITSHLLATLSFCWPILNYPFFLMSHGFITGRQEINTITVFAVCEWTE